MKDLNQLTEGLSFLSTRVTWARGAISKGEVIDLASLQQEVERLCRGLEALPADQAAGLQGSVLALLEEIEQLKLTLCQGLEALKAQVGETGERRRALRAYGQQAK